MANLDVHPAQRRNAVKQWVWYGLVVLASILCSVIGILYAAAHNPADGGRGGAVAVMIAFVSLFIRRDFGLLAYKAVAEEIPNLQRELQGILAELSTEKAPGAAGPNPVGDLKARIDGILADIQVNASGQTRQNFAVAVASIIGTLAWGFGDIAAVWMKSYFRIG